jgi:hypothetical protein
MLYCGASQAEGVERTFATNALAPFQLTVGLVPLLAAASGRKLGGGPADTAAASGEAAEEGGATAAADRSGAGPMLGVPTTMQVPAAPALFLFLHSCDLCAVLILMIPLVGAFRRCRRRRRRLRVLTAVDLNPARAGRRWRARAAATTRAAAPKRAWPAS